MSSRNHFDAGFSMYRGMHGASNGVETVPQHMRRNSTASLIRDKRPDHELTNVANRHSLALEDYCNINLCCFPQGIGIRHFCLTVQVNTMIDTSHTGDDRALECNYISRPGS